MLKKLVKKGADIRTAVREIQEAIVKGLIGGTKEFILDPATVGFGIAAEDITTYATEAAMLAVTPGHGAWAFCTELGYYFCYNATDVTYARSVGWKLITPHDITLPPYVAGSNGEQRVMVQPADGISDGHTVMVVLPTMNSGRPTMDALSQSLKLDHKYEVDTSLCYPVIVVTLDNTNCLAQNSPTPNGAPLTKAYFDAVGLFGNERGWVFDDKKHVQFEYYPDGLPGEYTRTAWSPVGGTGLLLKSSTSSSDGWGNSPSISEFGYMQRFTVPEKSAVALGMAATTPEVAAFTFTTSDGKTVYVTNGIITSVTTP